MKILLQQEGKCSLFKVAYTLKFHGCQCHKDCDCMEEWINNGNQKRIEEYTLFDGKRTSRYKTIENAILKMNEINENKL